MFALRFSRTSCVSKHANVLGRRLLSDVSLPIPTKPKGWPTPWITETEATEYLFPLYSQGWYISATSNKLPAIKTAGLTCRFAFPSCPPATSFLKDVLTLADTENHHPSWLKLTTSGENALVHICTTTHSALRPEWDATDTSESRALQGITLRDLRFAALISSLPSNTYRPSTEIGPSPSRPAWEELCATLRHWAVPTTQPPQPETVHTPADDATGGATTRPKKGPLVCVACAGPHATSACPTRHSIPSPPCPTCQGAHWRVDCSIGQQAKRSKQTASQVKRRRAPGSGGYEPPRKPCPNCGGPHWKEDCRLPQAPPQLLDELLMSVPKIDPFEPSEKVDK
ncbi:Pterin-4-alpha-carbinolamine dehydratase 2 [Mycena sanguinolenta]|uniref:4a-hydroxytetrahydrobiopterin dehydratase n=1 Tax=Mycena sanguinolenta TaxID=230812 RepID=A0A8H7DL11_9AGAR|nr:Pterin-4-alpha-carbinolamine dehydratase 2 [Mycena sanguinolenta]